MMNVYLEKGTERYLFYSIFTPAILEKKILVGNFSAKTRLITFTRCKCHFFYLSIYSWFLFVNIVCILWPKQ